MTSIKSMSQNGTRGTYQNLTNCKMLQLIVDLPRNSFCQSQLSRPTVFYVSQPCTLLKQHYISPEGGVDMFKCT